MLDGQAVKFAGTARDTQGSSKSPLFCNALPLRNTARAGGISLVKTWRDGNSELAPWGSRSADAVGMMAEPASPIS